MTMTQIIVGIAIATAIIAALIAARSGGPRVTVIETKSEPKDGDDA